MRTPPNGGVRAARSPRGGLQRRIVDHAFGNRRPAYRPARRASSQCHRQRRRGSRLRKRRIFKRLDVVRQRCSIAFERASALRNVQRAERHNQEAEIKLAGTAGVCQTIAVPTGATLTLWVYEGTNDTIKYVDQEGDVRSTSGTVLRNLFKEAATTGGWVQRTYSLSAYAGEQRRSLTSASKPMRTRATTCISTSTTSR